MLTPGVTPTTFELPRFEALLGPDRTAELHAAAAVIREALAAGTLWHVNSTGNGGGVAEMLHTLLPLYAELGVRVRWMVIGGDERFFALTKRLGLGLYGIDTDDGPLRAVERDAYLDGLGSAGDRLLELVEAGDVVVLHDHQTAGLVPRLAGRGVEVYWRCHVGVDEPTEASERAWELIAPLLDGAHRLLFSVPWHIPERFRDRPASVLPPFISPFSPKNRELEPESVTAALIRCGLRRAGGNGGPPVTVIAETAPGPDEKLLTQVSRWDRLKDMDGVLAAVTEFVPEGFLALVGPDPAGIADDIEQAMVFDRCHEAWRRLPPGRRRRVALVCLPMTDPGENALLVNAIQRASQVVMQKSLAEGFGLTVTEAMWKSRPVVAAGVGGIRAQIDHGRTGLLVADPHDLSGFGALVTSVAGGGADAELMGARAHDRVLRDFLPDQDVIRMARLLRAR
ncbi:glycosyltransferase [Nonomuraea rubra]|uniref:glycosyltransferase n=1 Tax=Nonomuraea rubra TaxID=46180 RepID=UPI0034078273